MANCSYRCDEPFSFLRIRAGPSDRRPARQSAKSAEKSDSPEERERRKENEHVPQPRTIGSIRRAQVSLHGVIKSQDDDAIDSAAKPCKPCAQKFHRCGPLLWTRPVFLVGQINQLPGHKSDDFRYAEYEKRWQERHRHKEIEESPLGLPAVSNSVLVEMRSDHAGQSRIVMARIVMGEINRGANSQQQK